MTATHDAYIHGTQPSEQQRLAALNRLTNAAFIEFLHVEPGAHVLEVGSGLGLLAADIAAVVPGVDVYGVERSVEQLAAATTIPNVHYVHGDAHALDFPDGTFDLVYARYVLEHVSDPLKVVGEMKRVTRVGGRVAVCENDITLVRLDPPCDAFGRVWNAFAHLQRSLGGDALIGRRLYRLFRDAGLSSIDLSVQPEVHWSGSPRFVPWIRNLIGNVESGRQGLIGSRLCSAGDYDEAIAELTSLLTRTDASAHFMWNRAMGVRTE